MCSWCSSGWGHKRTTVKPWPPLLDEQRPAPRQAHAQYVQPKLLVRHMVKGQNYLDTATSWGSVCPACTLRAPCELLL